MTGHPILVALNSKVFCFNDMLW